MCKDFGDRREKISCPIAHRWIAWFLPVMMLLLLRYADRNLSIYRRILVPISVPSVDKLSFLGS